MIAVIPDHQQPATYVLLEVPEEFNDLGAFDRAGVQAELEAPQRQSGDDRNVFPREIKFQHRGLGL